jgi:hypothetical protein
MTVSFRFSGACVAASTTILLASAPAEAAALKPITGKLDRPGYTVIAMASNGQARSVVARRGTFRLRPPAARVVLHLRTRAGTYGGPIVIARAGKRAIVGVKAGARLGKVRVNAARGYARLARPLARRWLDRARWARARAGVPIGARNFGRVRSAPPQVSPPGDQDADGVANPLDVDDDGDLVLDDVDRHRGSVAQAAQAQQGSLSAFTLLYEIGNATFPPAGPMTEPVNANAIGPAGTSRALTEADIDNALRGEGKLSIGDSGKQYVSGELDCGGLAYCSAGGTGMREQPGGNSVVPLNPVPFPSCCDSDGNGLGAFDITGAGALNLFLDPHASSDQIRTGDVFIARGTCTAPCGPEGSTSIELAGSLASVFATVPAIASYTDELDVTHEVPYPLAPSNSGFPSTGATGAEIALVDGPDPDSDVAVKLTFWRPQRRAIPEEVAAGTSEWIDMGGLIHLAHTVGAASNTWCPADSYSNVEEADGEGGLVPSQVVIPGSPELGANVASVFIDADPDQSATPGHTFSYTLNVSKCLRERGGGTFDGGAHAALIFDALLPPVPGQPVNFAEAGYSFYHQPETPPGP